MLSMPWYAWVYLALINFVAFRVVNSSMENREYLYGLFESLFFIALLVIVYAWWTPEFRALLDGWFLVISGYAVGFALFEASYYSHLLLAERRKRRVAQPQPGVKFRMEPKKGDTGVSREALDLLIYFGLLTPSVVMGVVIGRSLIEQMVYRAV